MYESDSYKVCQKLKYKGLFMKPTKCVRVCVCVRKAARGSEQTPKLTELRSD